VGEAEGVGVWACSMTEGLLFRTRNHALAINALGHLISIKAEALFCRLACSNYQGDVQASSPYSQLPGLTARSVCSIVSPSRADGMNVHIPASVRDMISKANYIRKNSSAA
jgi:hypothetical protein